MGEDDLPHSLSSHPSPLFWLTRDEKRPEDLLAGSPADIEVGSGILTTALLGICECSHAGVNGRRMFISIGDLLLIALSISPALFASCFSLPSG